MQQFDGFEPSDSTSPRPHQKRQRQTASEDYNRKYVSEACVECKKKHTKCDGKNPCSRCVSKQLVCTFPVITEKKKRGPTPGNKDSVLFEKTGATKHYLELIQQMSVELEQYRRQAIGLSFNPQSCTENTSVNSFIGFESLNPNPRESDFLNKEVVRIYLSCYEKSYLDLLDVPAPSIDFYHYAGDETGTKIKLQRISIKAPAPYKLQWYAILTSGARVFGNIEHAEYLHKITKYYAKELFDETNGVTASGLTVMAYYFAGMVDIDKSIYYLLLAKKMFENLTERNKQNTFRVNTYSSVLTGMAQWSKESQEIISYANKVRKIPNVNATNFAFSIILEIRSEFISAKKQKIPPDVQKLTRLVEFGENFIRDDDKKPTFLAILNTAKSRIQRAIGNSELSLAYANTALELILPIEGNQICMSSVFVLADIIHIHYENDYFEGFSKDVEKLRQLGRHWPMAIHTLEWFFKNKGLPSIPTSKDEFLSMKLQGKQGLNIFQLPPIQFSPPKESVTNPPSNILTDTSSSPLGSSSPEISSGSEELSDISAMLEGLKELPSELLNAVWSEQQSLESQES